ncbi:EAL domain-containing protein [Iodobacter ciconiae]|uniref:histidine kinase n=1 Tax=Iodobacter ciconiae TaxID=2496266 RepID=A0A3S8ZTC8_9NEIS|nr:EAL domain-containing protein [Iodobacter ciconiae]AZN36719.1 EAL domain-containing protein [Iodobacter ciconiae]
MPAVFHDTAQLQLIDQIPCGIYLCHSSGQCRYTNSALQTMLGLSAEDCAGDGWLKNLHPDDRERVHGQWLQAMATQTDFELSFRILRADQQICYLRTKARPLPDAHGQISGYIGSMEELTFNHIPPLHYHTPIKAASISNAIFDKQGKLIYLNPAFSSCFGYQLTDIPLLNDWWSLALPVPEYRQWVFNQGLYHDPLSSDNIFPALETHICCKDGSYKTVKVSQSPLPFVLDQALLITLIDLGGSEQQQSQENPASWLQLAGMIDSATDANQAKNAFLSLMGHEIRTPLNSILGMAYLAQLTPLDAKQSDYLNKITLSAGHLLDLMNDILDSSKIEAGKLQISMVRPAEEKLTVSSQPGRESEFKFSQHPVINTQAPSSNHHRHSTSDHCLVGKHILLADDHPFNQQIAAELLQIAGAEVTTANNGLEALQLTKKYHFDAILMDMQMPQMDGISACIAIRKTPAFESLPIIAITANVSREHHQSCLDAGMNDFIGKPIDAEKLYQTLAYWLGPEALMPSQTQPLPQQEKSPASISEQSAPLINLAELHNMLGEDPARQRKYCTKFVHSFKEGLSNIQQAHKKQNQTGPQCHRLKSIARTVGAIQLGRQLSIMEKLDPNIPPEQQLEHIELLQQLFRQSCESLQQKGLLDMQTTPCSTPFHMPEKSTLCILLVDDDDFMLEIIQQHLNDLGISQVLLFPKAKDALARLARQPQPDWIFCDLQMPDMDGVTFLRQLGLLQYEGYIAILSAMDEQVLKAAKRLAHSFHLKLGGTLTKPVKKEELAQILLLHPAHVSQDQKKGNHLPQLELQEEEIRKGLAEGEVELYYQPKVSTGQRKVIGAESLARWRHPQRGLLGPHLFVPAIETLGLIDDLTLCVLKLASRQLRIWLDQGEHIKLSINVSMGNLHRLELPELFQDVLRENNITPDLITLEITETQLTHDYVLSLDILTRLRIMGFSLSVDDFGTGFSTMEHLIQIPFTELKIDKAFVSGATQDASARTILEHSADLGRKFSLNLVAEGVETQADWDLVSNIGCHEVQGYLIGHPMPADEFMLWKKRWESDLPGSE